ncbi:MAG: hypothetical protein HYV60_18565 [Planctomycetia bacterium]|nr:hypothetical protein [Planctomycetia bacterium]
MTRRLIIIPIVHSSTDFGSLAEHVKTLYLEQFGATTWNEREQLVDKLWNVIQQGVADLKLDYRKVRIYQDGLPICGRELQIVREVADAGSPNHQIVLAMVDKGATLVGTEDPQLLIQEYQMQRQQITAPETKGGPTTKGTDLLEDRDRFIAARIEETLEDGDTGLVFLGAAHCLEKWLDSDIRVETLR